MNKQTFEALLLKATQEFKGKKKMPTTPAKQFEKGARWLWDVSRFTSKMRLGSVIHVSHTPSHGRRNGWFLLVNRETYRECRIPYESTLQMQIKFHKG